MMSHGARFRRKANCPFNPRLSATGSIHGTQRQRKKAVTAPQTPAMQNSARHDNRWLTSVPSGTPKRLATVMPAIITATACALRPGPATRAATIDPTPK